MGDSPLSEREVMEEFDSLGINMDTEIDYYALAKSMMGLEEGGSVKPEVVMELVVKFAHLVILIEKNHLQQKNLNESLRNWKCYS